MALSSKADDVKTEIEQTKTIIESGNSHKGNMYHPGYLDAVFTLWYSNGKPNAKRFISMLPDPADYGVGLGYPSESTVRKWIDEKFIDRAIFLDEEVSKQLADRLVAEKVRMLEKHAIISEFMQDKAMRVLGDPEINLNANTALRMLIEGVRIERDSRGIPRTLEQMADQSDQDLLDKITDIMSRADSKITPLDEDDL